MQENNVGTHDVAGGLENEGEISPLFAPGRVCVLSRLAALGLLMAPGRSEPLQASMVVGETNERGAKREKISFSSSLCLFRCGQSCS